MPAELHFLDIIATTYFTDCGQRCTVLAGQQDSVQRAGERFRFIVVVLFNPFAFTQELE